MQVILDSKINRFWDRARYWSKIIIFSYPLHSTPPLGGFPSEYRHPVWYGKTRMVWLLDGENISKISYLFWHNPQTWQTYTQTDRQSQTRNVTAWRHRPRLCIASRGKNWPIFLIMNRNKNQCRYKSVLLQYYFSYYYHLYVYYIIFAAVPVEPV